MASKHPHKPYLFNRKTWKCALSGCGWFVHLGLQHLMINKVAVCWNCEEHYTIDEQALKREKPICIDCRIIQSSEPESIVPESVQAEEKPARTLEQQKAYDKLIKELRGGR